MQLFKICKVAQFTGFSLTIDSLSSLLHTEQPTLNQPHCNRNYEYGLPFLLIEQYQGPAQQSVTTNGELNMSQGSRRKSHAHTYIHIYIYSSTSSTSWIRITMNMTITAAVSSALLRTAAILDVSRVFTITHNMITISHTTNKLPCCASKMNLRNHN